MAVVIGDCAHWGLWREKHVKFACRVGVSGCAMAARCDGGSWRLVCRCVLGVWDEATCRRHSAIDARHADDIHDWVDVALVVVVVPIRGCGSRIALNRYHSGVGVWIRFRSGVSVGICRVYYVMMNK